MKPVGYSIPVETTTKALTTMEETTQRAYRYFILQRNQLAANMLTAANVNNCRAKKLKLPGLPRLRLCS